MDRKLYRSSERKIFGVCGGIAQYFGIDPTVVRLAWVALTLMGGSGALLYIVAAVLMDNEPGYTGQ
jgi:phage shock protein PspC (stress-responsive transcriptional regulator)